MKPQYTGSSFFDSKYMNEEDPWKFASDKNELERYAAIMEAISFQRYENIFEPGCSIGVLTEKLSTIAESVQAFDFSLQACQRAIDRCVHLQNVTIECASLENTLPHQNTNLLVLSEVGYYFSAVEWDQIVKKLISHCSKPLTILASHWLGTSEDHILHGNEVNNIINLNNNLIHEHHFSNSHFRLDRWSLK